MRDRRDEYPFYHAARGELELRWRHAATAGRHFETALALARNQERNEAVRTEDVTRYSLGRLYGRKSRALTARSLFPLLAALAAAILPLKSTAQAVPLPAFSNNEACPEADIYVSRANDALSQDQSIFAVRFTAAKRLLELGDAFDSCAKRFYKTHPNPSDAVSAVQVLQGITMAAIEPYFAATRAWADVIDLFPSAKRTKKAIALVRSIFATAAHSTLYDVETIKNYGQDADDLRRASAIEIAISDLATRYAPDQTEAIYGGMPH